MFPDRLIYLNIYPAALATTNICIRVLRKVTRYSEPQELSSPFPSLATAGIGFRGDITTLLS